MVHACRLTMLSALAVIACAAGSGHSQAPSTAPAAAPAPLPLAVIRLDAAFDALVAPGAGITPVVTIPDMSAEGPMWYRGRLWVSDQRGGNIYAIDVATGGYTVVASKAGGPMESVGRASTGPNGQTPYMNGDTLVARQGMRDIARLHRDGSFTPLLSGYGGRRFNAPNDLLMGRDGTLWFSDPTFSTPAGGRELPYAALFRYRRGVLTPVVTDMNLPNGIGLSPDGRTLYVNNTGPTKYVRAYDVGRGGELSNMRVLIDFPLDPAVRGSPDGLKVDSRGNVWTTGPAGVTILSPKGVVLGRIQFPQFVSNLAFGGKNLDTAFFTSGATIYRLATRVKGQALMYR